MADKSNKLTAEELAELEAMEQEGQEEQAPNNSRLKLSAARAAAHLPKGYVGTTSHKAQGQFLAAIESYGDLADAAAAILYDCAVANLQDSNRRGAASNVIADMRRQMEFITGDFVSAASESNLGIVSVGATEEAKDAAPEINVVS